VVFSPLGGCGNEPQSDYPGPQNRCASACLAIMQGCSQTATRCQRIHERTLECAACSRFSRPSRSPDVWSPQAQARIHHHPLHSGWKSPRRQTHIHRLLLFGPRSSRRRREKPWSGSRDTGIGMVADMSGSTAVTSSGLSGDIGKRGIGRGTAITGRGLGAAGVSKPAKPADASALVW
jgi:hypothetical protein